MTTRADPVIAADQVSPPAQPLGYGAATVVSRGWPWDVRVILMLGIVVGGLHVVDAGLAVWGIVRDRNVSWFSGGFYGWAYVLQVLFRAVLPTLLCVGLIGMYAFKPGARRLSILAAGALLLVGVLFSALSVAGAFAPAVIRPSVLVGQLQAICHSLVSQYGLLLILIVTLRRPEVIAAADQEGWAAR